MTKTKRREPARGAVFAPVRDMREFLEQRGDLRTVFDQVHRHFFEQLSWPEGPLPRSTRLDTRKRS